MHKLCFVSLFTISLQSFCQPNTDSTITRARVDKYYLQSYLNDYRDIFTSPFKPSVTKYVGATVYAGAMYLFISDYDARVQSYSQSVRTSFTNNLSKYVFEPCGSGLYPLIIVASIYATGIVVKNQRSKKVALNCVKSFLIANSFVQLAKYSFSRQRPLVVPPNQKNWFMGIGNNSFFSGHTTTAFSIATVLAEEYKKSVWVPIVCYTLAAGTGLSRINDNKHWASDVFTGALVGYLTGRLIEHKNNWGIQVVPNIILQR